MTQPDPRTLAVHAGEEPDEATGALDPPVVLSNAFAFESADDAAARFRGERPGLIYSRWENPSVRSFERKVAALEGAEDAVALASGMAAVHASLTALLAAGDHVVAPRVAYAETRRLLSGYLARFGVGSTAVDTTDPGSVEAALRDETRVVWVETPANPTLAVTDIAAVAALAHARGAHLIVDGTFATPYHQQPLALGADLVVHAATKAIGGHGDAVGGVVAGSSRLCAAVREEGARTVGSVMAPWVAYLLSRGARTLALRAERSSQSALVLAQRLSADPRIAAVCYPGLTTHPGHAVAARQMRRGFGPVLAFEVAGGLSAGRSTYDRVSLIRRAVSLGDVRTLITHPASTTHASLAVEDRRSAGIADGLMRLSVGIEDVEDIWADLDRSLP